MLIYVSDLRETLAFPADVVTSWTTLQLEIARTTPAPMRKHF
jgi:hypothetical protein